MTWKPILEGATATAARAAIRAIDTELREHIETIKDGSLARGLAGLALLGAYLHSEDEDAARGSAIERCIARAGALMERGDPWSLYRGRVGVAWTVAHLTGDPTLDLLPEDAIAQALEEPAVNPAWRFDLIDGWVGLGCYALERIDRTAAARVADAAVARLERTARAMPGDGAAWWTSPEMIVLSATQVSYPEGYYDLGIAHGVPGALVFLTRARALGLGGPATDALIERGVRWLLAQRLDDDKGQFAFAVAPNEPPHPTRSAWCYGDPGVAAALLLMARLRQQKSWEAAALDIGLRALPRSAEDCLVDDAGLCHGAAGLAHIYNRMYQASGDERFLSAARGWFERTLAMRRIGKGIAGFEAIDPTDAKAWADPGFLTGAAGVALALLAAVSEVPPDWDRVLLLSHD